LIDWKVKKPCSWQGRGFFVFVVVQTSSDMSDYAFQANSTYKIQPSK
jgi:hypothetical protein